MERTAAFREHWRRTWVLLTVAGLHGFAVGMILAAGYVMQRYAFTSVDVGMRGRVGVQYDVPNWLLRWTVGSIVVGGLCMYAALRMSAAEGHGVYPDARWPTHGCICITALICAASSVLALVMAWQERGAGFSSIALVAAFVVTVVVSAWDITRRTSVSSSTEPDRRS